MQHGSVACCAASDIQHLVARMIDVMEENGGYSDRDSGTGSADGQWHHVAVTWASQDGHTHLYLDGRKVCPGLCSVLLCYAMLCGAVRRPAALCCALLLCAVLCGLRGAMRWHGRSARSWTQLCRLALFQILLIADCCWNE